MSDSRYQRAVDEATWTEPTAPDQAVRARFSWQRWRRQRTESKRTQIASAGSNPHAIDDMLRTMDSGGHRSDGQRPSPRGGDDRSSTTPDPSPTSHGFGAGVSSGSGSGATNAFIGASLLTSTPIGGSDPASSAEAASSPGANDAIMGVLGEDGGGNRSLFDGNSAGNVVTGSGDLVSGAGSGVADHSSDSRSLDGISAGASDPGEGSGSGLLDSVTSSGSSDGGGSGLFDGIASGGSGDGGGSGLLDGLGDGSGCFDLGCSNVLLLFIIAIGTVVYLL